MDREALGRGGLAWIFMFRVQGLGFRVYGFMSLGVYGFRAYGLEFRA